MICFLIFLIKMWTYSDSSFLLEFSVLDFYSKCLIVADKC